MRDAGGLQKTTSSYKAIGYGYIISISPNPNPNQVCLSDIVSMNIRPLSSWDVLHGSGAQGQGLDLTFVGSRFHVLGNVTDATVQSVSVRVSYQPGWRDRLGHPIKRLHQGVASDLQPLGHGWMSGEFLQSQLSRMWLVSARKSCCWGNSNRLPQTRPVE